MSDACRDSKGHFAPCEKQPKKPKGSRGSKGGGKGRSSGKHSPTMQQGTKPHSSKGMIKMTKLGPPGDNRWRVKEPGRPAYDTRI